MTNWTTQIPSAPTPNLIIVTKISQSASEKTVKDFFLFCGKILEFELQKSDDGDRQVALVLFEKESAARTACMLTNAMIVDSQISVRSYFEDAGEVPAEAIPQENKPKATVLAEILAAGYGLSEQIIEKGLEIDAKYGLVGRVQAYVESAKAQAKTLDEKYQVSTKVAEVDAKYHVQDRVHEAAQKGLDISNQALQTAPGQKVAGVATQLAEQIAAVHYEARRLADEKKAKTGGASSSTPAAASAEPATEEKSEKAGL